MEGKKSSSGVVFKTDNLLVQRLFDTAIQKLEENKRDFLGKTVIVDGAGYNKLYLESTPMTAEMYAKVDLEIADNIIGFFFDNQREDGRIPGSILMEDGKVTPQFNKIQGLYLPEAGFNLYYWLGRDKEYLKRLYHCLESFDDYLWKVRDSNGDGCLESWCQTDTGEDYAMRYGDASFWWESEKAPEGFNVVPMASMDFMSYSYSCRNVCAKISAILENGKQDYWKNRAEDVMRKIEEYLWNEEIGACFDRDNQGRVIPILIHNTLRCMYFGAISRRNAERFVEEHLCNENEFWTPMPLPSVALNDPMFRNIKTNNWSGQPNTLTYQRAILALERYGYEKLIPRLGRKLFEAVGKEFRFTQQFDVYTGYPSCDPNDEATEGYGIDNFAPTMCAVLDYISRMYGIHLQEEEIWWGITGDINSEYTQVWGNHTYTLKYDGNLGCGFLNDKKIFEAGSGKRVVTDYEGNVIRYVDME